MLRAVLAQTDGLRIGHVAGLWRLRWVPLGHGPERGTYVHYDADVMLAVLALEAHRAGAGVAGEDLGTVEPELTEALADRGRSGARCPGSPATNPRPMSRCCRQRGGRQPLHARPAHGAGVFRGEHVRVRADLGLLDDVPTERERAERLALLRSEGLLPGAAPASCTNGSTATKSDPDEVTIIVTIDRFLAATSSRLKLISPSNVIAEPRQPNLHGTVDEYPNWRPPLPQTLGQLRADPRITGKTVAFREGAPARADRDRSARGVSSPNRTDDAR
jgi:4-alpha-glucanotransferase